MQASKLSRNRTTFSPCASATVCIVIQLDWRAPSLQHHFGATTEGLDVPCISSDSVWGSMMQQFLVNPEQSI